MPSATNFYDQQSITSRQLLQVLMNKDYMFLDPVAFIIRDGLLVGAGALLMERRKRLLKLIALFDLTILTVDAGALLRAMMTAVFGCRSC